MKNTLIKNILFSLVLMVISSDIYAQNTHTRHRKRHRRNYNRPIFGFYYRDYLDAKDTINFLSYMLLRKQKNIDEQYKNLVDCQESLHDCNKNTGAKSLSKMSPPSNDTNINSGNSEQVINNKLIPDLQNILKLFDSKNIKLRLIGNVAMLEIQNDILFRSGKYNVTREYIPMLSIIADVLNKYPNVEFIIEGNTDKVPYSKGILKDNWDLSTKRATSVAREFRLLHIDPHRMIAAGRGEFNPIHEEKDDDPNLSVIQQENRRTTIIILPKILNAMQKSAK